MIYGLYLSATGVLTNSYRQDVIANNLANSETVGFKRSLALFQQRRTEAEQLGEQGDPEKTSPTLEGIGGGLLVAPTGIDFTQGMLEQTNNHLDVAIHGRGFFAVKDGGDTRLTRNGRLMVNAQGYLSLAGDSNHRLLDVDQKPIQIGDIPASQLTIGPDGTISTGPDQQVIAQLAVVDVPDESKLSLRGNTLMRYDGDTKSLPHADGRLEAGFLETSNVDPMTEMTQLINSQRQLEANANMIRFQDQTLSKLVNDVGKIG